MRPILFAAALVLALLTPVTGQTTKHRPNDRGKTAVAERNSERVAAAVIEDRLGIRFSVIASKIRRSIISTRTPYGFMIRSVRPDSPAARAGLKRGDIFLRVDGDPIRRLEDLAGRLKDSSKNLRIDGVRRRKDVGLLSRSPWRDLTIVVIHRR